MEGKGKASYNKVASKAQKQDYMLPRTPGSVHPNKSSGPSFIQTHVVVQKEVSLLLRTPGSVHPNNGSGVSPESDPC